MAGGPVSDVVVHELRGLSPDAAAALADRVAAAIRAALSREGRAA
jgi:hypothetical protein